MTPLRNNKAASKDQRKDTRRVPLWHLFFRRDLVHHLLFVVFASFSISPVVAQSPDCDRLRAQIAAIDPSTGGRPSSYNSAAQRQQAEIERTSAYAQSLGCDRSGFSFFGGQPPQQCNGLNARIRAMQANLGQLQGMAGRAGGSQREDLVARYNSYCRSQPRGFFESLFGGGSSVPVQPDLPQDNTATPTDDDQAPRGGSQAICVRTCDGGFFPLNYSARRGSLDSLGDLCHALCPNTEVVLYTRSPSNDVGTAVSADGQPYRDLQNAFKYQKSFDPACTCKPKGESWVQALTQSDAERLLGQERKGDIIVTPQQSLEMSKPKIDLNLRAKVMPIDPNQTTISKPLLPATQAEAPAKSNVNQANADAVDQAATQEITGPDGVKRRVRKVGPTP